VPDPHDAAMLAAVSPFSSLSFTRLQIVDDILYIYYWNEINTIHDLTPAILSWAINRKADDGLAAIVDDDAVSFGTIVDKKIIFFITI
jgi:hypothetical protein